VLAAFACATLPNGVLQASGAKNDCLLAMWLIAMTWFALRYRRTSERSDALAMGAALSLALFTKATAYLYAPPMLAVILVPALWRQRDKWLKVAAPAALFVVLVNGPQFWRNYELSGSPLGYDSAQGDGFFRWRNETLGWRPALSNVLRNLSEQVGSRNEHWNNAVFEHVIRIHAALKIDPNDPNTTWRWLTFQPPANSNHEADANNRRHLVVIAAGFLVTLWLAFRRDSNLLLYLLGPIAGFLLFCAYLKWQPYLSRLFLPLGRGRPGRETTLRCAAGVVVLVPR
jgi:4-amino-4-deoxy-L-arabinose transferase-like glycosyltransferase